MKGVLFLPPQTNSQAHLRIHFHTQASFIAHVHQLGGLDGPLLVFNLGSGSARYQKPFEDEARLDRFIALVEAQTGSKVDSIDVTSFSAGYGAVRELLKVDRHVERIRRVILCDSLYASWDDATTQPTSQPASTQMQPFVAFARRAAAGEKTLVVTASQVVPPNYASTLACARFIADQAGVEVMNVDNKSDAPYRLIARADARNLHIWFYTGNAGEAHVAHVHSLDAIYKALDDDR